MITRLSAFVFGSHPSDDAPPNTSQKTEVEAVNNTSTTANLVTNAHDEAQCVPMRSNLSFDEGSKNQEDWVFIDVLNKNVDIEQKGCSEAVKTKNDEAIPGLASRSSQSPPATPNSADSDASGWLVTPPACFITRRPLPPIAASPMDNLLIEHPSMSVYVSPEAAVNACRNAIIDAISAVNSECGDDAMDATDMNGRSNENTPSTRNNNRQMANNSSPSRNTRSAARNARLTTNQVARLGHENSAPWLVSKQAFRRMNRTANANKGKRGPPLFQPKPCGLGR
jgi:hypothetical protein